jgi:hypothetical protein
MNKDETNKTKLIDSIQTALKILGAVTGLVALIGLPSVYFQFNRFYIPTHFVSNEMMLKAGILPSILLAGLGTYFIWKMRQLKRDREEEVLIDILVSMPILMLIPIIFFFGGFSIFVLIVWGIFWLFEKMLQLLFPEPLSIILTSASMIIIVIINLIISRIKKKRELQNQSVQKNGNSTKGNETASPSEKAAQKGTEHEIKEFFGYSAPKTILFSSLGIMVIIFLSFLMIKIVLYIAGLVTSSYLNFTNITIFSIGCGIFGLTVVLWTCAYIKKDSKNKYERLLWIAINRIFIVIVLIVIGYFYSVTLHPIIPQAWGGGKPEPVTFWVKSQEFPMDKWEKTGKLKLENAGNFLRCEGVSLLYMDSKFFIFIDENGTGLVIPGDKIAAIANVPGN